MLMRLRSWLFWPIAPVVTTLGCTILALTKNLRVISVTSSLWGRVLIWFAGVKLQVRGGVPVEETSFVVVSNHSSLLDIPMLLAALGGMNLCFGSRPKFFGVPVLGWGMHHGGHFEVDRDSGVTAYRSVLRAVEERSGGKRSVVMFPEGTRSEDGKVQDFLSGAFGAAVEHGRPILPVAIIGLHEVLPTGAMQPRPSRVTVHIGEPIETNGMDRSDVEGLKTDVRDWMLRLIPA